MDLKKILGLVAGEKSGSYSRKWLVLLGLAVAAYFHPTWVCPEWLKETVWVYLGGQSIADAAGAFGKKKA